MCECHGLTVTAVSMPLFSVQKCDKVTKKSNIFTGAAYCDNARKKNSTKMNIIKLCCTSDYAPPKIVINHPRTNDKLQCREEAFLSSG